MQLKAAIYHFTNESKQRPKIYQDQLKALEEFTSARGWSVKSVYCDFSLKKSEHPQFDKFMSECTDYDILVLKDFYHISKNTMECMRVMKLLSDKGIQIYSVDNGCFWYSDVPLDKPLRVASYNCRFGYPSENKDFIAVQNDIFKLYVKSKTSWILVDQYSDESEHQNDDEQKQLLELIDNKDKYDLLLVNNLNDIHWRTAKFCHRREALKLDIYSLQDGFLTYGKENYGN